MRKTDFSDETRKEIMLKQSPWLYIQCEATVFILSRNPITITYFCFSLKMHAGESGVRHNDSTDKKDNRDPNISSAVDLICFRFSAVLLNSWDL